MRDTDSRLAPRATLSATGAIRFDRRRRRGPARAWERAPNRALHAAPLLFAVRF